MCLQGLDKSGQEQSVERSLERSGNSETPAVLKISSISWGISPANSLEAKIAWAAAAAATLDHASFGSSCTSILTSYGFGREPCTLARIRPSLTSMESTWPERA